MGESQTANPLVVNTITPPPDGRQRAWTTCESVLLFAMGIQEIRPPWFTTELGVLDYFASALIFAIHMLHCIL